MVERSADIRILTSELVKRMNEDTRRIRTLEQRIDRFELSLASMEESFESKMQEMKKSLDQLSAGMKTVSEKITLFESEFQKVHREIEKRAMKMDLKEMENYISLMNPIATELAGGGEESAENRPKARETHI
jgi:TolA-binding protein